MAKRSEKQNKIIEDLTKEISELKATNEELTATNEQLKKDLLNKPNPQRSPEEMFQSASLRDQKHSRKIKKLEMAYIWICIALAFWFGFSCLLWVQIYLRYGNKDWPLDEVLEHHFGESLKPFADPRMGSIAVGFFDLIILVVGQRLHVGCR